MGKTCGQCDFFKWFDLKTTYTCRGHFCIAPIPLVYARNTLYVAERIDAEQNADDCRCFKRKTKRKTKKRKEKQ